MLLRNQKSRAKTLRGGNELENVQGRDVKRPGSNAGPSINRGSALPAEDNSSAFRSALDDHMALVRSHQAAEDNAKGIGHVRLYDDGGKVTDYGIGARQNQIMDEMPLKVKGGGKSGPLPQPKPIVLGKPTYEPFNPQLGTGSPEEKAAYAAEANVPAPAMQDVMPKVDLSSMPKIFDEGGEVDLDGDGKDDHQKALLSDGERVLSPEEAAQYEKEHPEVQNDGREGQPVTPRLNPPADQTQIPRVQGTQPQTQIPRVQSAASTPEADNNLVADYSGELKQPSYQPGKEPAPQAPSPADLLKANAARVKSEAALKGDLLSLGAAIIGQKALEKPVYGGIPVVPGQEIKPGEPVPQGKEAYQQKMAYYQKAYQDALDEFTPEGKERAANIREAMLNYEKAHPYGSPESAKPGFFGKVEHALADVGNVASRMTPMGVVIGSAIPQSAISRELLERGAEQMGAEGTKEAQQKAETEHAQAETTLLKNPLPKLLSGDENTRTNSTSGARERAWQMRDGTIRWVPEGQSPRIDQPVAGAAPAVQSGAVPAAQDAGTSVRYIYGKPTPENTPASPEEIKDLKTTVESLPYLTPQQKKDLAIPQGYVPTQAEVASRQKALEKLESAQRQGEQDKVNNTLKELASQTAQMLAQMHMQDEETKHQKVQADASTTADQGYSSLYAQKVYDEKVRQWHKSGNFAKDVALVGDAINQVKDQKGAFSSLGTDAGIGGLLGGTVGAVTGGVLGVAKAAFGGPADAALEALKKQGISKEGYDAMQAYFNALPSRLSYETSVLGVKASTLRQKEVLNKIMNTVPPPNTPEDVWKNSFDQYYKPMQALTERKTKMLPLSKDYTKPSRTELGYPEAPRVENSRPKGATHTGVSSVDGQEYYLDAQSRKLSPRYKSVEE